MKRIIMYAATLFCVVCFTLNANAWCKVTKSGFGLFGYQKPIETHWGYPGNGIWVCAATLECNGGGFNTCKWTIPLNDCERNGTITIKQNPVIDEVFQDNPDNQQLYQISAVVDQNIMDGHTSGTIIYAINQMVIYNQDSDGIITFTVYGMQEAQALGLWPVLPSIEE